MPKVWRATARLDPDEHGLAVANQILEGGGLVAIPTETVYGLAADAENVDAVAAIFEAKGRPSDQPVIVHARPEWAQRYAEVWTAESDALASAFWPGPLTLVVPRSDRALPIVTGQLESVGIRCPSHPVATQILDDFGRGLAAPSANRYGHVSPTTADHVLHDLMGRIDGVVDGGPCDVGLESTIVEIAGPGSAALLRRGGVTADQLSNALGYEVADATSGPVRAPGMVKSHYAPSAQVEIQDEAGLREQMDAGLGRNVLVIAGFEVAHHRVAVLGSNDASFAAGLYDALRLGDDKLVDRVIVVPPTEGSLLPSILDRLRRAAADHRQESAVD